MAEKSFLQPEGLFNPSLRFAFSNITDTDFVSYWDGNQITIKPGQTVELSHHLAVKFTNEMIDQIMLKERKIEEDKYYEEHPGVLPNSFPKRETSIGIPAVRNQYVSAIVRQLELDEEDPQFQIMRAQMKQELEADMSREKSTDPVPVPASEEDFGTLLESQMAEPKPKKPIRVKTISLADKKAQSETPKSNPTK